MTTTDRAVDQVVAALEGLVSALVSGRAEVVMAAEEPLANATSALSDAARAAHAAPEIDRVLARRIAAVRQLIRRCRALGTASERMAQALFARSATYGPGGTIVPGRRPTTVNSRY